MMPSRLLVEVIKRTALFCRIERAFNGTGGYVMTDFTKAVYDCFFFSGGSDRNLLSLV